MTDESKYNLSECRRYTLLSARTVSTTADSIYIMVIILVFNTYVMFTSPSLDT